MHRRWQLAVLLLGILPNLGHPADKPEPAATALGKLARAMQPGTWAELKTEGLDASVLKSRPPHAGFDLMGWSDDAFWDSARGQFYFMGLRKTRHLMIYRAADNRWRTLTLPEDHVAAQSPPRESQFGHNYSRSAFDPERGHFYQVDHNDNGGGVHRLDLASEQWKKLPKNCVYSLTGVLEYFSAREWLLYIGDSTAGKHNQLQVYDTKTNEWSILGPTAVHGYHSLARHNPFRQEVLLAGGSNSPLALARVTKAGKLEALPDFPAKEERLSVSKDKLTVDPVSGKYLILVFGAKRFYEYDSDTGKVRLLDNFTTTPWPFSLYDHPVVAFVPEHGITFWAANSRVMLYKHAAAQ
ncbi:MAG: hypothetical protein SFU86_12945 [Pirellulaceae bacterium]|nr:hypothetical protein [Pirellulaceae bacterium]